MANHILTLGITVIILAIIVLGEPYVEITRAGNYTPKEKEAISQLRDKMRGKLYKDYMKRDEYLIRWIRDQNFNIDAAKSKLSKTLKWRKESNIDSVLKEDFSDIEKLCRYSADARDKDGRPVLTAGIGNCPVRKIVLSGSQEKLRRMGYYVYELGAKIIHDAQAEGRSIESAVLIVDLNNFNAREHMCSRCIPLMLEMLFTYENNYPQTIYRIYGINVPRIFQTLVTIAKPFMSEFSRNAYRIYGFNKNEWRKAVLENISPDQLEPQFGGTKQPR